MGSLSSSEVSRRQSLPSAAGVASACASVSGVRRHWQDLAIGSFATLRAVVGALALTLAAAGCGAAVRSASSEAATGAVPAAANALLGVMDDEQARQRLAAALATPEMQRAMEELSGGLVKGVVMGLSSDEVDKYVDKLTRTFSRSLMRELARGIDADLGPAMAGAIGRSIDSGLNSAMSPAHQRQMEGFSRALVVSMMRSAAEELPQTMGPAMRTMMQRDLTPAMAEMLRSPEFTAALGDATHEIARQAVLGSNQGLAEAAEQRKHDKGDNPLGLIGEFFAKRLWLLVLLGAALVFSVPIWWLARERQIARRYREDAQRRNARAAALLGAMEAAPDRAWSSKILVMLREQLLEETTETKPSNNAKPPDVSHPGPNGPPTRGP